MNKLDIKILEQPYVLTVPESESAYIGSAIERLDEAMKFIKERGKVSVTERIAVLAGLNISLELSHEISEKVKLEKSVARAEKAANAAKLQYQTALAAMPSQIAQKAEDSHQEHKKEEQKEKYALSDMDTKMLGQTLARLNELLELAKK